MGRFVLDALVAAGHKVRCLIRNDVKLPGVEHIRGDAAVAGSLHGQLDGCDAMVHLVGIIEEDARRGVTFEIAHVSATEHLVKEAIRAGVQRCVFVSANGARKNGITRYQTTKWKAEQLVRTAGFTCATILRPSLIFGDPGPGRDDFCTRLVRDLIRPFPVLPVFGSGMYCMQPIDVETVAAACAKALAMEGIRTYELGGRERVSFVELLDRLCIALGVASKRKLHSPLWLLRPMVGVFGGTKLLPVTGDQLAMLVEGNTCDAEPFYRDFGLEPKPFLPHNLAYVGARTP